LKALVRYNERSAIHPQIRMKALGDELKFKVFAVMPVPIADCWLFWIEHDEDINFVAPLTKLEYRKPEDDAEYVK